MTGLGIVLLVLGVAISVLFQMGIAPDFLLSLPIPIYVYWIIAAAGALLIYFNRRTHD